MQTSQLRCQHPQRFRYRPAAALRTPPLFKALPCFLQPCWYLILRPCAHRRPPRPLRRSRRYQLCAGEITHLHRRLTVQQIEDRGGFAARPGSPNLRGRGSRRPRPGRLRILGSSSGLEFAGFRAFLARRRSLFLVGSFAGYSVSAGAIIPRVPVENSPTPQAGGVNPDSGKQRRVDICSGGKTWKRSTNSNGTDSVFWQSAT
jgi:hypothetical protein